MQLTLLPHSEQELRMNRIRQFMADAGIDAVIIGNNANIYYLTGRIFTGYIYIPLKGMPIFFVKRPHNVEGDSVVLIRKPEDMPQSIGLNTPATLGLELDAACYTETTRLHNIFPQATLANASAIMRKARAVKTPLEIEKIKTSGIKQARVYSLIPSLYAEGMRDFELQVEIEKASRLEGCLGQFRISGDSMELYMASLLVGENADIPTPYDFAMGGEGMDPSLPVGCNGTLIKPGLSVMADVNGNYTGYMTDMTRTFKIGELPELALKAHKCSMDICHTLEKEAKPGVEAKALYSIAEHMAEEAGLKEYFMGHKQKAGFVGHGVGIEVNELPVLAPRSRDILEEGNVIAIEPKFVIPHVGAVGIENTYLVTSSGLETLTTSPEEITDLL
ncbi:MAG: Xaa-Pro peptidase family protein [Bacteroides sp.]|nr:Xaa-Pro peptidase family protein [Bacteroides sp.]